MTSRVEVEIVDVPKGERARLLPILDESFEGLYLWHARRTLQSIEVVRAARIAEEGIIGGVATDAGLLMLRMLGKDAGYVYYVAVPPRFRRQGIGGKLLDDAIAHLSQRGAQHVYASVEEDNLDSNTLFHTRGFEKVSRSEMAARYGQIKSLLMYREMMVVPGEILLGKRIDSTEKVP